MRWKFSIAVLLPVIAAVLLTVGLAAGFFMWSAGQSDTHSLGRQQALAAKMIETTKADFATTQTDVALRYDVVDAFMQRKPDLETIDDYFGTDEYDFYGHDRVYVLSPDLKPIYAARAGEKVDTKSYDADQSTVEPLARRLLDPAMQNKIVDYQNGDEDYPPQVTDYALLDGKVALVSILPIVSDWEDQEQKLGHFYFQVAIEYVGSDAAQDVMDMSMLEGVRFDTTPDAKADDAVVPMANSAGRFVAWFKWTPERPGAALLGETLPASVGLLGVVGVVIALLLFGLARSTRALEKARAEALHRATHDALTGLANRALFTERLERSPLPLTLLALDLDRFKQVNDTLGHEAGDELLRQVATRLSTLVREGDLVARLGGDEFMILLSGSLPEGRAQELAGSIVNALAVPFRLGTDTASIGVSVGIATAVTDERKELVSRADFALYDAKESGRNTFRVFDDLAKAA
jgi:diguanylate cyclase (GGDEF)-like protein